MSLHEIKLTATEVAAAIRVHAAYLAERRGLPWPPRNGTPLTVVEDVYPATVVWETP